MSLESRRPGILVRFRASGLTRVTNMLAKIDGESWDGEGVVAVRASVHTLKGEARMLGLSSLARFVELVEAQLGAVSSGGDISRVRTSIELIGEWLDAPLVEDAGAAARLTRARAQLEEALAISQVVADDSEQAQAPTVSAEPLPAGGPAAARVLVVDDSTVVRMLLGAQLGGLGLDVLTAKDGEEALDLVRHQRPALLLTDIRMPRMDGFELLERIREFDASLPIIVLTGEGSTDERERASALGADGFIVKSKLQQELEGVVGRYLTLER